jgi:hypothetical protein
VINGSLLFMFVIESCVRAYVYRLRFVHDRMCMLDAVVWFLFRDAFDR